MSAGTTPAAASEATRSRNGSALTPNHPAPAVESEQGGWFFACGDCDAIWANDTRPYKAIWEHACETHHRVAGPYWVPVNGCGEPMYHPPLTEEEESERC